MQNPAQAGPAVTTQAPRQAVLHLRGATREEEAEVEGERRSIRWAEDVVDNEGLGKKSSKGEILPRFFFAIWGFFIFYFF
jgi:protein phosphatase 1 regulatory subunit 11